jgi:hypothetical protein
MTTPVALSRTPSRDAAMLVALAAALVSLLVGVSVSKPDLARVAVALPVVFLFVSVATSSPRAGMYCLVGWLVMLGLLRRLLTPVGSSGSFGDPLLLVGPILLVVLFLIAVERGAMRNQTPLSKAVLGLTVVLALSALNPLQGGLSVGLAGALLVVVPMLAFWVGRSLIDEHAVGVLTFLLGTLAFLVTIYGLMQTFYGMPSWDQQWIEESGYRALNVGGAIRAFGTSSSAAEYAAWLGVGILAWRAIARRPSRLLGATAAIALIGLALWLESSRGIVVLTLAALWLTFAAVHRMSIGRAVLVGAVLLFFLPTAVGSLNSSQSEHEGGKPEHSGTSSLTEHQVEGLSDPFGKKSTLGGHFELIVKGVSQAATNPVGSGVGATTIAAKKFNGTAAGTEADPGNAPTAAGVVGLVLYLLVAIYGIRRSYQLAALRRTMPAIAALGIILVTFLQWLNGGQYAIIPLPWLLLGWVDRVHQESSSSDSPLRVDAQI